MAKKRTTDNIFSNRNELRKKITDQDREVNVRREEERGNLSTLRLERIKLRAADTRPLNEKHVTSLKESIAILGLIEPLAVDADRVLLAGGHRLAAIKLLQDQGPEIFLQLFPEEKIPVRVMPFSASKEPERALQIEVAENEHRRDYTPAEVRSIAEHLRSAGYQDVSGRPNQGEKPLMPALSVVVGKSLRTLQRYLKDSPEKSTTDVALFLKRAKKSLMQWEKKAPRNKNNKELLEKLPELFDVIDKLVP